MESFVKRSSLQEDSTDFFSERFIIYRRRNLTSLQRIGRVCTKAKKKILLKQLKIKETSSCFDCYNNERSLFLQISLVVVVSINSLFCSISLFPLVLKYLLIRLYSRTIKVNSLPEVGQSTSRVDLPQSISSVKKKLGKGSSLFGQSK